MDLKNDDMARVARLASAISTKGDAIILISGPHIGQFAALRDGHSYSAVVHIHGTLPNSSGLPEGSANTSDGALFDLERRLVEYATMNLRDPLAKALDESTAALALKA